MAQRLIDLSMATHEGIVTFSRVQPPKIMMLEGWKESADNIGKRPTHGFTLSIFPIAWQKTTGAPVQSLGIVND